MGEKRRRRSRELRHKGNAGLAEAGSRESASYGEDVMVLDRSEMTGWMGSAVNGDASLSEVRLIAWVCIQGISVPVLVVGASAI